jgi:hypothetical protein
VQRIALPEDLYMLFVLCFMQQFFFRQRRKNNSLQSFQLAACCASIGCMMMPDVSVLCTCLFLLYLFDAYNCCLQTLYEGVKQQTL